VKNDIDKVKDKVIKATFTFPKSYAEMLNEIHIKTGQPRSYIIRRLIKQEYDKLDG